MDQQTQQKELKHLKKRLIGFGILAFVVYYVLDASMDYFLFGEDELAHQFFHPELHEFSIRILSGCFITLSLCFAWVLLKKSKAIKYELIESNRQLLIANRDLDAFNHSLAHDLRGPLSNLQAACSLLEELPTSDHDERIKICTDAIFAASQKSDDIISALQRLADVRLQQINFSKVDLSELATASLEQKKTAQPDRNIEWLVTPNLTVHGDIGLLHLAIENLISNAWKFTSKTPAAKIEIGKTQHAGGIAYYIRDNGSGFPEEATEEIFKPFHRFHQSKDFPGTGIGLATVQRVIERHDGAIWAEGAKGRGATIFFTLP